MNKLVKSLSLAVVGFAVIYFVFSGFSSILSNDSKVVIAIDNVPKPEDYVSHNSPEFLFKYPKTWYIEDTKEGVKSFVLTTIKNYNDNFYDSTSNPPATNNLSKITIAKVPKNSDQSFQAWLDDYVARGAADWGTTVLEKASALVDGYEAIFQMEQLGVLPSPVMYINRDTSVYIIIGGSRNPLLDDVFHRLVKDFRFSI